MLVVEAGLAGRSLLRALGLRALGPCALVACSSTPLSSPDGANDAGAPPPVTQPNLGDACADWARPLCAADAKCAPEAFAALYPDQASCVALRAQDCLERRSAPGNGATASDVEACANAKAGLALSCDALFASEAAPAQAAEPACAFAGTLPDGSACIDSGQCASGSCGVYGFDACGTCVTRAPGACVVDRECPYGWLCWGGVCQEAGALGDACDSVTPCLSNLTCAAGTCAAPAGLGEDCKLVSCAPNLWCNYQTLLCERPIAQSAGGDCTFGDDGSERLCPAGTTCRADSPSASATAQTYSCQASRKTGEPCSYNRECGLGLKCYEGTCTTLSAQRCAAASSTSSTPSTRYPASTPDAPSAVPGSYATVLAQPKIVLVTFAGDAKAAQLGAFVSKLGRSAFWTAASAEYGVGSLRALSPLSVAETPPAALDDADVRVWLEDKLRNDASFPPNDGQTLYVIAYPAATTITTNDFGMLTSCNDFGGYHQSFVDAGGQSVVYAVIPRCWYGSEESVISHEAVEAATDPFPFSLLDVGYAAVDSSHLAWSLIGGGELADLCEWQPLAVYVDDQVGGRVQRSWSNARMAAFHHPCAPARAGSVYFNAVPEMTDTVSVLVQGSSAATRGIAIPLGQSRTVAVMLLSDGAMPGPFRVSAYGLKQWRRASANGNAAEPTLRFSFDRQSGVNGDTLKLTLTPLAPDPDYASEPFVLVSRYARDTNVWLGLVGQN